MQTKVWALSEANVIGRSLAWNLAIFWLLLSSCARGPLKDISQNMRLIQTTQTSKLGLSDQSSAESFLVALNRSIEELDRRDDHTMVFGQFKISSKKYLESLKNLSLELRHRLMSGENFSQVLVPLLKEQFVVCEVYGLGDWSEVFVTGYFTPQISASQVPTENHTVPLYTRPEDLVKIDWSSFVQVLSEQPKEPLPTSGIRFARVTEPDELGYRTVRPHYSRQEIEEGKALSKESAIAYVHPVDGFFLQIQGSGKLLFPDGQVWIVGYDGQNGHPYVPIGKYLFDVISREEMSMQKIEGYLRSLEDEASRKIMYKNPSYVFFKKMEEAPQTYFGVPPTGLRTIATDRNIFPQGTLAYLTITGNDEGSEQGYFLFNQDTGGAIRGPGRVDLYTGEGEQAKGLAGAMKNPGKLYFFLAKSLVEQHEELYKD